MVEGFFKVEVAPLPKSQNQAVGAPVDASVKLTTSGEQPDACADVKFATGVCANTSNDRVAHNSVRIVGLRVNTLLFNARLQAFGVVDVQRTAVCKNCSGERVRIKKF